MKLPGRFDDAYGAQMFYGSRGIAGIVLQQGQAEQGIVEIGLERDSALERRADVGRRQACILGQLSKAVTGFGLFEAMG